MRAPSNNADGYYAANLAALQLQEGWASAETGKAASGRTQAST